MGEIQLQIKNLSQHAWDTRKERGVTKRRRGLMQKEGQNKKRWIERFKERRRSEGGERGNIVRKVEKEGQERRKGNWISSNLFWAQQASSLSLSSYLLGYRLSSGLALFLNSFFPFFSSLSLSFPSFSLFRFSITLLRRIPLLSLILRFKETKGPVVSR